MKKINLIALINDQGLIINKTGFADFDMQEIYDESYNQFPAGIDVNGKLYCVQADVDNTVLNHSGERIGWNAFSKIEGYKLDYLKQQMRAL